jgi:hypothetical protein
LSARVRVADDGDAGEAFRDGLDLLAGEAGHRNKSVRLLIMRVINVMPLMMGRSASVVPEEKP